jgi:siroheme synthase-like protein
MFPIFLDLREQLAVVVGGGPVGRRRVQSLVAAGARVRLVCLSTSEAAFPEEVELITAAYHAAHLDGARLVIAAAPDAVNRQVVADAHLRGIWVNCASDRSLSDFHVPAVVRRGQLVLALSTGGAAPTLTRVLRERLEEEFDIVFGRWVELLGELRPRILLLPDEKQGLIFERLCRWEWLERLRREPMEAVRASMLTEIQ